jgi:hypothetical protein
VTDAPLSKDRAKARLNWCLEEGLVIYTRHFREELVSDGFTMQDVLTICKAGAINMQPEKDIKTGQWKFRIDGITTERRTLAVVFTFRTEAAVFITAFERKR